MSRPYGRGAPAVNGGRAAASCPTRCHETQPSLTIYPLRAAGRGELQALPGACSPVEDSSPSAQASDLSKAGQNVGPVRGGSLPPSQGTSSSSAGAPK
jgi:hypothetical protein